MVSKVFAPLPGPEQMGQNEPKCQTQSVGIDSRKGDTHDDVAIGAYLCDPPRRPRSSPNGYDSVSRFFKETNRYGEPVSLVLLVELPDD